MEIKRKGSWCIFTPSIFCKEDSCSECGIYKSREGQTKTSDATKLAEEHWVWVESILHKVYVDAMVHGIKHGEEEKGTIKLYRDTG